jgi:hypothetical protein
MHAPDVGCEVTADYRGGPNDHIIIPKGGTFGRHQIPAIAAGGEGVFFCSGPDDFTIKNEAGEALTLAGGTMAVWVKYETWVPWTINRESPRTNFTFLNTSTGYRWVKGNLIK